MGFYNILDEVISSLDQARNKTSSFASETIDLIAEHPGKAALGAVVGVGAIAAVPFTGGGSLLGGASLISSLAGATAIASATGAAVTGAVVSAKLTSIEDQNTKEIARKEGEAQAKAVHTKELMRLKETIEQTLKDSTKHFDDILALVSVATAVANADSEICNQERHEIMMFISGKSAGSLPRSLVESIQKLFLNPISLEEAFEVAVNSGIKMEVFDEVITVTIHANDELHDSEMAFIESWNRLKSNKSSLISSESTSIESDQKLAESKLLCASPAALALANIFKRHAI
jgi:tellurite resistance protein